MCELNNQRGKKYCGICAEPLTKQEREDAAFHMQTDLGLTHLNCWMAEVERKEVTWQYRCTYCDEKTSPQREYCNADCREESLR